MNKLRTIMVLLLGLCLLAPVAQAKDWWEQSDSGGVWDQRTVEKNEQDNVAGPSSAIRLNWVDEYIEVMAGATVNQKEVINKAHAISVASKTARHLAYEKLAETIKGINITSNAVYDRELMMDSNLRTSVNALIRGAKVVEESHEQLADGSIWAQVRLGIHLKGKKSLTSSTEPWFQEKTPQGSQPAQSTTPAEPSDEDVTGLIVEAGDLGLKPAMSPKIYSQDGKEIYGFQDVASKYLTKFGMVGYAESVKQAKSMDRVGDSPMLVRASDVRGKHACDVVVPEQAADRIQDAAKKSPYLSECRVVFVVK